MADSASNKNSGFRIEVTPDRMKVTLIVEAGTDVDATTVTAHLRELKLARFDDGLVIESLEKRKKEASVAVVVASGGAPIDERPERVNYRVPLSTGETGIISKVEAGQVLAGHTPAVAGTDGVDVFGKAVTHRKTGPTLQIGRNLTVGEGQIVAAARGNLRLNGTVLSVEPLLEVRGDDGNAAPINFDGDAVIVGSLHDGRSLQISGSLIVGGAMESVELKAGGSVHVKGGIVGKQKGKLTVGGDLWCRFISGGTIIATGDIHAQSEIANSRIGCTGRLTAARGPIFGGIIAANGGISCGVLGNPSAAITLIEAGDGVTSRSFILSAKAQIEANAKRVREIREKVKPLLAQLKYLTPQQREKATELLYDADEMEAATEKLVKDLEARTQRFSQTARAEVIVAEVVYPGVTVRFPSVETIFTTAFKGPFTLTPEKLGNVTEIVLVDGSNGAKTVLPTLPNNSADTPPPRTPDRQAA